MDNADWKKMPIMIEGAKGAVGITAVALVMAEIAIFFRLSWIWSGTAGF